MKILWSFLRPNIVRIVLLAFLAISTSLIIVGYEATSKVSWQGNRGMPFHFVTISGYNGPCPGNDLCRDADIQSFNPWALIIDVAIWYLVACTMVLVYEAVKKQGERRSLEP
jgi:hypothetical protein